jgi:hypothetical protein
MSVRPICATADPDQGRQTNGIMACMTESGDVARKDLDRRFDVLLGRRVLAVDYWDVHNSTGLKLICDQVFTSTSMTG